MVGLLELRHLVLDHLDPGGVFHQLRPRLEQRRLGRDRVGLADHLGVHPRDRPVHVGTRVGVPDVRRHLLVGIEARRCQGRVLHRLAEPDRPARHRRVGRVRMCDLPRRHARLLRHQLHSRQPEPGLPVLRGDPGARLAGQHLLQPPAGGAEQHLGVVARVRCSRGGADPDLRAQGRRAPRVGQGRVHRHRQQHRLLRRVTPTASASSCTSCPSRRSSPSTRSPATTRRRTCRRRRRARPTRRPRASGARSSTPASAAGSCCCRSCSRCRTRARSAGRCRTSSTSR